MKTLEKETEAWLAIRKEAAKAINPATARVTWEHGYITDPYRVASDLTDEEKCIGRNYFARAPLSDVWVSFDDLPKPVVEELWRRIKQKDGPSPFDDLDDLPNWDRLVAKIMARDEGEPGYAAAVARSIAAHFGDDGPEMPAFLKRTAEPTAAANRAPRQPDAGKCKETSMLPPFNPDPECPFCSGEGFKRIVGDGFDQVGRCDCTNWSSYAALRRAKGLTMKQALEHRRKTEPRRPDETLDGEVPF